MEVLGQSLQDLLTQYHYTQCAVVNIAIQAVRRRPAHLPPLTRRQINHLEYIHSKHYIHGDIKPSNLLVGTGTPRPRMMRLSQSAHARRPPL